MMKGKVAFVAALAICQYCGSLEGLAGLQLVVKTRNGGVIQLCVGFRELRESNTGFSQISPFSDSGRIDMPSGLGTVIVTYPHQ